MEAEDRGGGEDAKGKRIGGHNFTVPQTDWSDVSFMLAELCCRWRRRIINTSVRAGGLQEPLHWSNQEVEEEEEEES